ncbi:hypothetical protein HHK36_031025 [Tetracentron sinense]|uniref:Uncharacterized protein n=1 Tax=Tetracentron sinense TaxID=13715 RepID=A0A834YCS0_TETSI|nr:hypothetical protein HHK36_031025 [Tetracentron sinense]
MGAAYGAVKIGVGVASISVTRPELVMKSIVPFVTASVLVKRGGLSTGDVAVQYKYENTLIDIKVHTKSNVGCFRLLLFLLLSFTSYKF